MIIAGPIHKILHKQRAGVVFLLFSPQSFLSVGAQLRLVQSAASLSYLLRRGEPMDHWARSTSMWTPWFVPGVLHTAQVYRELRPRRLLSP